MTDPGPHGCTINGQPAMPILISEYNQLVAEKNARAGEQPVRDQLAAVIAALGKSETELASLRAVARGYCPACGRGDAAPTVADWEQQKQRADDADEAARRALVQRQEMAEERYIWQERGDRAEAFVNTVADIIADHEGDEWADHSGTRAIRAAITRTVTPTEPAATQATDAESCPQTTPDNPATSSNTPKEAAP